MAYQEILNLFKGVLVQTRKDKIRTKFILFTNPMYVASVKENKLYEFGSKVSVGWTASGVIVGALGFRNEYDGYTVDKSIEQVEILTGVRRKIELPTGAIEVGEKSEKQPFSKKQSAYRQHKEKIYFRKRAGIEPLIGYLKPDHRFSRNFYKGIFGDNINVMLAAATFNFKRMMNKWKTSFYLICSKPCRQ